MKLFVHCLAALGMLLSLSSVGKADIETPFPLGAKAPLPWESIDGYWTDWKGDKYFYRIEILEVYKDGSRTVSVSLMDETGNTVVGNGLGFVRANSKDLWARLTGASIDIKFRLQAYYEKGSLNLEKKALIVSLQDMKMTSSPLIKHALVKVNSLDGRIVQGPDKSTVTGGCRH